LRVRALIAGAICLGKVQARVAEELLGGNALPFVGKVAPRPWTHIHVDLAVLAHQLATATEHPQQQRPLFPSRRLFDRVRRHPQVLGREFQRHEIP